MNEVSPARKAAFSILKTMEKYGHSDTLLRERKVEVLSDADRKLTTALVLGVLRWQVELDSERTWIMNTPVVEEIRSHPERKYAIKISGLELSRARGGARCMTMPLVREDVAW